MTREEAKKLLPVIEAYSKGKNVQYYDEEFRKWFEISHPAFTGGTKYRVMSEPKYRPFNSKEECWNEMQKHKPFAWVIEKKKEHFNINSIGETGVGGYTYRKAFEELIFADVQPFGLRK